MGSAHRAPLARGSIAAQAKQDSARAASSPTQALSGNTALLGARGATGAGVCLLDAAAEDAEKKRLRDARRLRKKEQRVERAMEDLLKVLTSHSESVPVSVSVSVSVPVSVFRVAAENGRAGRHRRRERPIIKRRWERERLSGETVVRQVLYLLRSTCALSL